jgi:uncharacterized membrane protein
MQIDAPCVPLKKAFLHPMPNHLEKPSFGSRLGHNFLTGMFLVLPIGLTFYVVSILVGLIAAPVQSILQTLIPIILKDSGYTPNFSSGPMYGALVLASALIMAVILITLGWLSKRIFGRLFQTWFAFIIERMPGLGALYNTIKQMVDALSGRNKDTFRRVVLVQYPRANCWSIAFVTQENPEILTNAIGQKVVNVFIPSAPAPTAGFVLQVPADEIKETKLTVPEAIGLLMSFGAVVPQSKLKS